jgi:transcriptional regulator with XRE-family HTH domain
MARRKDKEKAIVLRKQGMSYSQIKNELGISKSTLSGWLRDMPLSTQRVNELRANSTRRIELFRNTMRQKREERLTKVFSRVANDIGKTSDREFFIAGFFLYWAEGGKTTPYSITLSNTDPKMIRAFLQWLALIEVPQEKIKIRLHLYSDMVPRKETVYWAKELSLSKKHFMKPYIKRSKMADLTYSTHGHGTCNAMVHGRDIAEYVHQGLRYISSQY